MDFQIGTKVITTPMDVLLHRLQFDLKNGKLHDIKPANGQNIRVTCPQPLPNKNKGTHLLFL